MEKKEFTPQSAFEFAQSDRQRVARNLNFRLQPKGTVKASVISPWICTRQGLASFRIQYSSAERYLHDGIAQLKAVRVRCVEVMKSGPPIDGDWIRLIAEVEI